MEWLRAIVYNVRSVHFLLCPSIIWHFDFPLPQLFGNLHFVLIGLFTNHQFHLNLYLQGFFSPGFPSALKDLPENFYFPLPKVSYFIKSYLTPTLKFARSSMYGFPMIHPSVL